MRVVAFLLAVSLVLAGPPAAAQISLLGLKNSLVRFVLSQISVEGEFEIEAQGVEEPRDGVTELVGVTVSDGAGVWLRAEGVAVSWNASRILRGELEIGELVVRGLDVSRAPTPPEVTVNEDAEIAVGGFDPFAWPRVPIATRVEEMRLVDAFVAAGVIAEGASIRFDAEGSFRDEGEVQSLTLDVARRDEVEGRIRLDYARRFDAESLDLTLEAREAAGGLVAALGGLPSDAESQVSLRAEGPLTDWSLDLSADVERMIAVSGSARIGARAPISVTAELTARPGPALDPVTAAALGETASLSVRVREDDAGRVEVETARIASPGLAADLSGFYSRSEGRMTFDVDLAALSPLSEAIPGLDFDRIGFAGRLEGLVSDFAAEGRLSVVGLESEAAALVDGGFDARVTRNGEAITLTAEGRTEGLRLDRLGPDVLGAPTLTIEGAWDLGTEAGELRRLALDSPALSLSAGGRLDLAGGTAALDYAAESPAVGPLAAAYGAPASGAFSAEGRLEGPLTEPRLEGALTLEGLEIDGADWGGVRLSHAATLGAAPSGELRIEAEATPYGPLSAETAFALEDERLRLSDLVAEALSTRAEGALAADLSAGTATGELRVTARDLSAFAPLAGVELGGAGEATLTLTAADGRQDARLSGSFDDLSAAGAKAREARIDATARDLTGAPSAEFEVTLEAPATEGASATRLRLSGEAEDLTGASAMDWRAVAEGVSAGDELSVTRAEASGRATDLMGAPRTSFSAAVEEIAAAGARVASATASGEARDLTGSPAVTFEATAEAVEAQGATVASVTASGEATDLTGVPAVSFEATAEGLAAQGAEIARLTATGRARDLTGEPALQVELRAEEVVAAEGATVAVVTADLHALDLAGAPSAVFDVVAEEIAAAGVTVARVAAEGRATDLTGAPQVDFDASAEAVAGEGFAISRVTAEGVAQDLTGAPSARVSAMAEGLSAAGVTVARLTATGRGENLIAAPGGRLEVEVRDVAGEGLALARATLSGEGRDLTGSGALDFEGSAEGLSAGGAEVARLTLSGRAGALTASPEVSFEAEAGPVSGAVALARLRLEGALRDLAGAVSGRISGEARDFAAGGASLRVARFEAEGTDLLETPEGRAALTAEGVGVGEAGRFRTLELTVEGGAESLSVALDGRGRWGEDGPLRLVGAADGALVGEGAVFEVSRLALTAGEMEARLAAPLTLRREGGTTRAEGLDLRLPGDGRVEGAGALHAAGLEADLRLAFADLSRVARLLDAPLAEGSLRAEARIDTRPGRPGGRLDLVATGLRFADVPEAVGPVALTAEADWDGRRLAAEGELSGDFGPPARVEATLPLVPAGLLPAPPAGAEIDAGLTWAGEIGELWAAVPAPDHLLSGRVDADLRLRGPVAAPRPAGRLTLTGGAYQNLETGTILTEIEARTRLRQGGGITVDLSAKDGAEGPVEAEVSLGPGGRLEARLTTDQAVLVRRDDLVAAITAEITAEGPVTAPLISGDVLIDRAEVRLVQNGAPSLPDLGEVIVKGAPRETRRIGRERGPRLDITVRAPGDLFVRGRGLDSEWEASLEVSGPLSSPRVTGEVRKRRGTLVFIGRDFTLERGRVTFRGAREIDPQIDVALEHERSDILGRIVVRGFASDPEIAFQSVPALPEGEVLPRVLFGKSRQSLSASQAVQLGSGVATLLSGREGLLGGVRSAVGLDVLSVDLGEEDEAASVRAGRNLSDDVYVGVRQPVDGSSASVEVEVEVLDNITVDGETSAEGASVGLNWKLDF